MDANNLVDSEEISSHLNSINDSLWIQSKWQSISRVGNFGSPNARLLLRILVVLRFSYLQRGFPAVFSAGTHLIIDSGCKCIALQL